MPASEGPLGKAVAGPMPMEPDEDMPMDSGRVEKAQALIDALGVTGADAEAVADALDACMGYADED